MIRIVSLAAVAALSIAAAPAGVTSAYDVTMTGIDGTPLPFAQYKGKVIMVVNTASMCGNTPQYEGLEKLYEAYNAKGLTIIGVPSKDFGDQEFGSNKEVKTFCDAKFGIKFPLTETSTVKGPGAVPFYRWAAATLGPDQVPTWNFHKYLVGRDGKLIRAFGNKVQPGAPEVTAAVEAALASKS
ncbi:glutathione peroxidase [Glacieibacterium sp.]|uniref:glutathione peroxidase n=1 Tax=Glacieibacterium sp. TaxID=2860237 RepID=UPI003AFFB081